MENLEIIPYFDQISFSSSFLNDLEIEINEELPLNFDDFFESDQLKFLENNTDFKTFKHDQIEDKNLSASEKFDLNETINYCNIKYEDVNNESCNLIYMSNLDLYEPMVHETIYPKVENNCAIQFDANINQTSQINSSNDLNRNSFTMNEQNDLECLTNSNDYYFTRSLQNLEKPLKNNLNSSYSLPVLSEQNNSQKKNKYEKIRENVFKKKRELEATGQKAAIFGNKVVEHGSLEYIKERERNKQAVRNSRARRKLFNVLQKLEISDAFSMKYFNSM